MPTTLPNSIADASLTLKWREQYVSQGLNKALRGLLGRGIVRGFRVAAGAGIGQMRLIADSLTSDSVILAAGSLASSNEALAYRETSTLTFTMTGVVADGVSAILAVVVDYQQSIATTAEWRVYTEAEYTANQHVTDKAVVLCRFTMPNVAGPITLFDTTVRDEKWKWEGEARDVSGDSVALVNMQPGDRTWIYRLRGQNTPSGLTLANNSVSELGDWSVGWTTTGAPDPGTHTALLAARSLVRQGDELVLRIRYAWGNATVGSTAVVRFSFFQTNGESSVGVVNRSLTLAVGNQYTQASVIAPSSAALVKIELILSVVHSDFFTLNSCLVTAPKATSSRAGAPDVLDRVSSPGVVVCEQLALFADGAYNDVPSVVMGGGQTLHLGVDPLEGTYCAVTIGAVGAGQSSDIFLNGSLAVGYIASVTANNNAIYAYSDNVAAVSRRRVLWQHNQFTAGVTSAITNLEGAMELVSGAAWDSAGVKWDPDFGAIDVMWMSVKDDGVRVYTIDRSQFPGTETDANATVPLYIPVLKRLASEAPAGKAVPKLKFDVSETYTDANLILECQQGTAGQSHRLYEFANGPTNSQVWETVNAKYDHNTDTYSGDTAHASTYRFQSNAVHVFSIVDPTYDAYPNASGAYSGSFSFQMNGARPELVILKGASLPTSTATRLNGVNQDFRVDFGVAASNTALTSNAESTNPISTLGMSNTVRAKNTIKAWGIVALPVTVSEGLEDGFNVTAVEAASGDRLLVTFATGMAGTSYLVNVTHDETGGANAYACTWERVNANSFYIYMYPMGTGARANPNATTGRINFTVLGVQ